MTQLESAKKDKISEEMVMVAKKEGLDPSYILEGVKSGHIVIPCNSLRHTERICGIGKGLKTKVNANVGTSQDLPDQEEAINKMRVAIEAGADAVMDLSTGEGIATIRKNMLKDCPVPFGTVPIYEAACKAIDREGAIRGLTADDIFDAISAQARDGVDFMTIHSGITFASIERLKQQNRLINIVSRGGAFLAEWILLNDTENPLFERFDEVLDIARKYDITISLGDGMRPGTIADATDRPQIQELILLGELAKKAKDAGVQVMIEGPGHIPIDQIEANVLLEKRLCDGAPFYVLGPLVTDVAPGYDHITAAIGGAIAAMAGADFLCYVTPSEHLSIPSIEDVKDGVIASRIAAHAADIAKGVKGALDWDIAISGARKALDWNKQIELSIDKEKASLYRKRHNPKSEDVCTMCSDYCSIKNLNKLDLIRNS